MQLVIDFINILLDSFILSLFGVLILSIVVLIWGMMLPVRSKLNVTKKVNAPVHRVWELMTDWSGQIDWRKDIKSVDVISKTQFIENPVRVGRAVHVDVVSLEPNKTIVLTMSGPFKADYRAQFSEQDGATLVAMTGIVVQRSILGRIPSKLFGFRHFVDVYYDLLNAHINKPCVDEQDKCTDQEETDGQKDQKGVRIVMLVYLVLCVAPPAIIIVARMMGEPLFPDWVQLIIRSVT